MLRDRLNSDWRQTKLDDEKEHSVGKKKTEKKKSEEENLSRMGTSDRQLDHSQFRKGGVLSLFLGNFLSEEELDTYLSETFPVDFGFVIDPRAGPEGHVSSDRSCPVGELLRGFSRSADFVEVVTKALVKDGWHRSKAAVVFYNFCYDPNAYRLFNAWNKLKFRGTFLLKERTWIPFGKEELG
jgi:hypothetical protein